MAVSQALYLCPILQSSCLSMALLACFILLLQITQIMYDHIINDTFYSRYSDTLYVILSKLDHIISSHLFGRRYMFGSRILSPPFFWMKAPCNEAP